MLDKLKSRARALKTETYVVYLAARDSRTPWFAKAIIFLIVAYAISPIDLIPDFVPVFGYLDDLIVVPAGIALALRLIPRNVMEEARAKAGSQSLSGTVKIIGAGIIVIIWILAIIVFAFIIQKLHRNAP